MSVSPRRRWFRLSLRGLMILILIIACGIGWKVSRDRSERQAVEAIRAAGGMVLYDYQYSTDPEVFRRLNGVKEPAAPRWLRTLLGDDFFRTVVAVQFSSPISPDVLESVARLDGLINLNLIATQGLEDAWPVLGRLTRLEKLNLYGPGVNDQAIQTFGKCKSLWSVHLSRIRLSDKALEALTRYPKLRDLSFAACGGLTDDRLARLLTNSPPHLESFSLFMADNPLPLTVGSLAEHHRGLRQLALSMTPVADVDLAPLGALTALTDLNLQQTQVTDAGLVYLSPLRNLETLTINLPGVTDEGLKSIGPLRNLRRLDLTWSHVSGAGLAALVGMNRLQNLSLAESQLTDTGAAGLGSFPSLEILNVQHTAVTDAALVPLSKLTKLQSLALGGTKVTPEGVATLQAALPKTAISTTAFRKPTGPPPTPPH